MGLPLMSHQRKRERQNSKHSASEPLKLKVMSPTSPVRLFPCLLCWKPDVKCPNYVFLNRSACVDCQNSRREPDEKQLKAAEVHEVFVRYLLERYSERGGITYEKVNEHIARAKHVNVDDLLAAALDYIFRNFRGIYDVVCDEVEAARDRGPVRWTPVNLTERLERLGPEQQKQERRGKNR